MTLAVAWELIKRFGPYIGILLALVALYWWGYSNGADRWHGKYNAAIVERDEARDTAKQNADEVIVLDDAIERNRAAAAELERLTSEREAQLAEAHRTALARQATAYQRAAAELELEAKELRERVRLMSVAETCHEAWLEVAK